jgi:hypothetical protein
MDRFCQQHWPGGNMDPLPEYIDELPYISGSEQDAITHMQRGRNHQLVSGQGRIDFNRIKSACAVALHMHQPLIPAGGNDLHTAELISNLQYMQEHPDIGDNHNASVFHHCYKRMGEYIPQMIEAGKNPRIMLEYSGTLFYGLRKMGLDDVFDSLHHITTHSEYKNYVEWLGAPWGHAVAPSTPVQDYRYHVLAWQQHFAAIFGWESLARVRGFSPSEMALPNHPDVAYEFIKTLKDCGYQWVLVQEHSVQQPHNGRHSEHPHLPHRLQCSNSNGDSVSMIAIIKTQGSDTKLVGQMQPWYEASGLARQALAGKQIPPLVTQIADGENGGVMMNEFPQKYFSVVNEASWTDTPLMNVSEYLEQLFAEGIRETDFPVVTPLFHKQIWERMQPGDGSEKLKQVIADLKQSEPDFHMEGGSWTNDLSWVRGYDDVLDAMQKASSHFEEKVKRANIATDDPRYRNALFHLLSSQTSCYRYWGQGMWTDYGNEICRRVNDIIDYDLKLM